MFHKLIFRIHNGQAAVEKGNAVLDGIENLLTEIGEGLLENTLKRKKKLGGAGSKTKVETTVLNNFESTFVYFCHFQSRRFVCLERTENIHSFCPDSQSMA